MPHRLKPLFRPAARGALLLAGLTACDAPTPPDGELVSAAFSVAPVVAPGLASFAGTLIDNARVRVVRPVTTAQLEVVADTSVLFPATATQIAVRLRVPLRARSEKLLIVVDLRMSATTLLSGSELVEVFAEGAGPSPLPRPVLVYVGPGETVRTLRLEPRDTVLTFGTSFTFRVAGLDQNSGTVSDLLLRWSTSSPLVPVSQTGALTAPSTRGAIFVRAETPTAVRDSVRVRFAPPPTVVLALAGNNQVAAAGSLLPLPLVAQVRAADGAGVPGVIVRFRALTGNGSVGSIFVVTDDNGDAKTSAQLGGIAGIHTFEALVVGLLPVVFTATAF